MPSLTLYDAARCPYCGRTRITLAEKGVAHEVVEIDLENRPAWIYGKNPSGRVPVLELDGRPLPESAVIGEYLDERFPEPPLWPFEPEARAAARVLVHRFDEFSRPYYALRRGEAGARERFDEALATLDRLLVAAAWLSGSDFGLADIAYLPWVLRARQSLGVAVDDFAQLSDWLRRAGERPSVAAEAELVAAL